MGGGELTCSHGMTRAVDGSATGGDGDVVHRMVWRRGAGGVGRVPLLGFAAGVVARGGRAVVHVSLRVSHRTHDNGCIGKVESDS